MLLNIFKPILRGPFSHSFRDYGLDVLNMSWCQVLWSWLNVQYNLEIHLDFYKLNSKFRE